MGTFLVLVTGYAGAGKTTLAPRLADGLDAAWISRDAIHERIYSGWEPRHPALFSEGYDPVVGGSTFLEGKVTWDIFLWTLQQVVPHTPVVADTPFNHAWNRDMFAAAAARIEVPMVEVVLTGDPDALLARVLARALSAATHELKAKFSVQPRHYYEGDYEPVLDPDRVVPVDTTELAMVDIPKVAELVRGKLPGVR
jgi:predicted kinase